MYTNPSTPDLYPLLPFIDLLRVLSVAAFYELRDAASLGRPSDRRWVPAGGGGGGGGVLMRASRINH